MRLTDVKKVIGSGGTIIKADPFGNNLAIACENENCEYPVLLIARKHQRGYSSGNPAVCKRCRNAYFLDSDRSNSEMLYICKVAKQ